jgi:predicted transcriptional regulator
MVSSKGSKSGALDAFWETIKGPSTAGGQMSDLLRSLSTDDKAGPEQKDTPSSPEAEKRQEDVLKLIKALTSAGPAGLTIAEIAQKSGLGPALALTAIQEAARFGLVAENNEDPERKRYRLTGSGHDLARA